MSETVLKILIDELGLIRIICEKCGATIELPIERLGRNNAIQSLACPAGCAGPYRLPQSHQSDPLATFADAVQALKMAKGCRIELILPQPAKP